MIRFTPHRPRTALLLGADGPLGFYLGRLLLAKGYEVHGACRRVGGKGGATAVPPRLRGLAENLLFHVHHVDRFDDMHAVGQLISWTKPDEAYNLVGDGRLNEPQGDDGPGDDPDYRLCLLGLIDGVRRHRPACRILQVTSHEAITAAVGEAPAGGWGEVSLPPPANQSSPCQHSAHDVANRFGRGIGLYIARVILFPHASPMQAPDRWPRTLTRAAASYHINGYKIPVAGGEGRLFGDMGHTAEFAEAAWLTLQQPAGGDWIIAQNNRYESDALEIVEERLKLPRKDWTKLAAGPAGGLQAPRAARRGNSLKALRELGWRPERTDREVVEEILYVDVKRALGCRGTLDEVEGMWAGPAGEEEHEAGGEGAGPAGGGESAAAAGGKKAAKKATRRKRA